MAEHDEIITDEHEIIVDEAIALMLRKIANSRDDARLLAEIGQVDPREFREFLAAIGEVDNEDALEILNAAESLHLSRNLEPSALTISTFLAQTSLFKDAPTRALDLAREAAQYRRYEPNTVIFQEGEPGEALYILESGLVKLSKVDLDGHEKTLAILRPPEFFGEMALLTQLNHSASAIALTKVSLYLLYEDDFFKLMNAYSTFSLSLTSTLAIRLKGMYDEAQILSFKDAQGRIAYVLLRLYHNGFIEFSDSGLALVRLTHQDIASLAGTSRETVTRALKSLENEGVIATRPKEVIINDPKGLEEILHPPSVESFTLGLWINDPAGLEEILHGIR